ncbi:MAG: hypothetical protein IJY38_00315 [Clostridia bacterium]|nr:hypothetical protein [Clostridia bacterium]
MFGYVRADRPNLYIKDDVLYKAMYCGVCKGISAVCGQRARMGLSYDITFLSVILHNIKGVDVKIEKSHCLTHRIRSKPMAEVDELTKMLGAINTCLAYYKYTDDICDEKKGRAKRSLFKRGYKRAKKAYPEIDRIIKSNLENQERAEKKKTASIDMAADATALMIAQLSDLLLEDKKTAHTNKLFYALGKWIYLIDALDDYDKDVKKGLYNPFALTYQKECKAQLLKEHKGEIEYIFHTLFYDIRESLSEIKFHFNRDLSDNILLRGLPAQTEKIMCCACKKESEDKEQK